MMPNRIRGVLSFPNPVNDKAARVVAGCVALLSVVILLTRSEWIIVAVAIGFGLRVLAGPRFSPLGMLATRVVAPRLGEPVLVPGPPKRFAQMIGLTLTITAAVFAIGFGSDAVAFGLIAVLLVFASLESVVGFCAGCWLFGMLMRAGVIPADTCEACNDIWKRTATPVR